MERDHAGILGTRGRAPGDALVGVLLADLGVPLLLLAADLGDPVEVGVIDLGDRLDALHELREVLELRPLVVCSADGHLDVDTLDHGSHC